MRVSLVLACAMAPALADILFTSPIVGDMLPGSNIWNVTWTDTNHIPLISDLNSYDLILYVGNDTNPISVMEWPERNFTYESYLSGPTWRYITVPRTVGPPADQAYFFGISSHLKANDSIRTINYSNRFGLSNVTGEIDVTFSPGTMFPLNGPARTVMCNTRRTCASSVAFSNLNLAVPTPTLSPTTAGSTTILLGTFTQGGTVYVVPTTPVVRNVASNTPMPDPDSPSTTTATRATTATTTLGIPTSTGGKETRSDGNTPPFDSTGLIAAFCSIFFIMIIVLITWIVNDHRNPGSGANTTSTENGKGRKNKWWNNIPLPRFGATELPARDGPYNTAELPAARPGSVYELSATTVKNGSNTKISSSVNDSRRMELGEGDFIEIGSSEPAAGMLAQRGTVRRMKWDKQESEHGDLGERTAMLEITPGDAKEIEEQTVIPTPAVQDDRRFEGRVPQAVPSGINPRSPREEDAVSPEIATRERLPMRESVALLTPIELDRLAGAFAPPAPPAPRPKPPRVGGWRWG